MSAEGKKKRGVSGAANGKSIPFRYTGGGVYPDHLNRVMMALPGMAQHMGRPRLGSAWDKEPQHLSYKDA